MSIGTTRQQGTVYSFYRCSPISDCPQRVTVSATLAESVVVDAVRDLLEGMRGTATIAEGVAEAVRELDKAELDLAAAVEAFTGLEDVDAARTRLLELREARDQARERVSELDAASAPAVMLNADEDWDLLTLDEQRAIIRAVVDEATVAPGRGAERIAVKARGK